MWLLPQIKRKRPSLILIKIRCRGKDRERVLLIRRMHQPHKKIQVRISKLERLEPNKTSPPVPLTKTQAKAFKKIHLKSLIQINLKQVGTLKNQRLLKLLVRGQTLHLCLGTRISCRNRILIKKAIQIHHHPINKQHLMLKKLIN